MSARLRGLARRARAFVPVSRARHDALAREHHQLALEKNHLRHIFETWVPPGHFYSPFPDLDEVDRRAGTLFATDRDPTGVDLREAAQVSLFDNLAALLDEDLPFPADPPEAEPVAANPLEARASASPSGYSSPARVPMPSR